MGWDAFNYLPGTTPVRAIEQVLKELGFPRLAREGHYRWYHPPETDELFTGVAASINRDAERITVATHTSIWAGAADRDLHNRTIRTLKQRFGGGWWSDFGGNAYLRYDVADRRGAEAACYKAYAQFENNLVAAAGWASELEITEPQRWEHPATRELVLNPLVGLNHLLLPFLVSIFEEFVKRCYVGLLRYSDQRAAVFKSAKSLAADDLVRISDGELTVEEAYARWMSFQNLDRIAAQFRDVNRRVDIAGVLRRPYRRRRVSLYDSLSIMLERRHRLIHALAIEANYSTEARKRDFDDMAGRGEADL